MGIPAGDKAVKGSESHNNKWFLTGHVLAQKQKRGFHSQKKKKVCAKKFFHEDGNISVSRVSSSLSYKGGKLYLWFPSQKPQPLANA